MKIAIIGAVAATVLGSTAAMAQSVEFGVGRNGPGVYVGNGYDRGHDWRRDREYRRDGVVIRNDRMRTRDRAIRDYDD